MKEIGRVKLFNNNDIVVFRNKVRLLAKALSFSEVESTRMATLVSEISRMVLQRTTAFQAAIFWLEDKEMRLSYVFENAADDVLPKDSLYQSYFDYIETTRKSDKQNYLTFEKVTPPGFISMDDALFQKCRTIINRLSEEQLLEELERKNQELIQAYKALEKSQSELLGRTQKLAKVGGWEVDLDTMITIWTDEVYRIHELPRSHKLSVDEALKYYPPQARSILSSEIEKAIDKGVSWDLELPFITAKGKSKWIRTMGYPEKKNEKTVRLSGVVQDVTMQKEVELKLEKQNEALEFKNKELEQFAYVASHDLQEPLRVISGYVDLLNKRYKDQLDENADQFLDFITDATSRMRTLIKSLLDYSRLGRRREFIEVDCNELIKNVLLDLEVSIKESQASIETEKLPVIMGLEVELKQLLQNLINNAIKFGKEDCPPVIRITAHENTDEWHFSVQDNGIGIEPKYQERIFVIFQRLHNREVYPGTGIGLAICKKVVELHGGNIWLESSKGEGTKFHFTIVKDHEKD